MNPLDPIAYNQPTAAPTPKIAAVGVAGAVVTALTYILARFNILVPQEVSDAFITIFTAASVIVPFIVGYFKRDKKPLAAIREIKKEEILFKG